MSSAEYRIASIEDFLKVPAEKQEDCLKDFASWLDLARKQAEVSSEMTDLLGGSVTFSTDHFFWIDDGIAGLSAIQFSEDGSNRVARIELGGGAQ